MMLCFWFVSQEEAVLHTQKEKRTTDGKEHILVRTIRTLVEHLTFTRKVVLDIKFYFYWTNWSGHKKLLIIWWQFLIFMTFVPLKISLCHGLFNMLTDLSFCLNFMLGVIFREKFFPALFPFPFSVGSIFLSFWGWVVEKNPLSSDPSWQKRKSFHQHGRASLQNKACNAGDCGSQNHLSLGPSCFPFLQVGPALIENA